MVKKSPSGSSRKSGSRRGKSRPVKEGDWFAVPLQPREAGFGVGLAARVSSSQGVIFGYFFALRFTTVPELQELQDLGPAEAVWREMLGPLGFLEGEWTVIGPKSGWRREDWPMPWFVTRSPSTQKPMRLTRYDDDDPFIIIEQVHIHGSTPREAVAQYEGLPTDGLAGHGYVEKVLSKKISESEKERE